MVYANNANKEAIDRVVALTCLSRKQVVQAMSNHRKRLKAKGYTDGDLRQLEGASHRTDVLVPDDQRASKTSTKHAVRHWAAVRDRDSDDDSHSDDSNDSNVNQLGLVPMASKKRTVQVLRSSRSNNGSTSDDESDIDVKENEEKEKSQPVAQFSGKKTPRKACPSVITPTQWAVIVSTLPGRMEVNRLTHCLGGGF
jgi:hypothetical protein